MRISTGWGVALTLVVSFFIASLLPGNGINEQIKILFGATTFVFGIITAFFISISTSRLNEVSRLLNSDDANMVSIYRLVGGGFGEKTGKQAQALVDNYLTAQIDYYLEDFDLSSSEFRQLEEYIINITPESQQQVRIYAALLTHIHRSQENRIRIAALAKQKLMGFEWLVVLLLAFTSLLSIFYLNNASGISVLVTVFFSVAIVMLLLTLRDLNELRWKDQKWVWESLKQTFLSLDLLPYCPAVLVDQKRIKAKPGEQIRMVEYPNLYPDMTGKKVVVTTVK